MTQKILRHGMRQSTVLSLLGSLLLATGLPPSHAADHYPNRPIKIVVPFSTGGTADSITRIVAEDLGKQLGQPVIVENRAGASGVIGTSYVARAAPDGYTLNMGGSTTLTIAPYLRKDKPYNSSADFTAVGMVAGGPFILAVPPKGPIGTLQELITYAKANPGKLNYGSSGVGSMHHVLSVKFSQLVDIDTHHIPFKGGSESATSLMTGDIGYLFESVSSILPMVQDGRVRAIAVTGSQRLAQLPQVPTIAEATKTDFAGVSFVGIVGPKGLPPDVVSKLGEALKTTLDNPGVRERIERLGSKPEFIPSERFTEIIESEVRAWSDVIRKAKIPEL